MDISEFEKFIKPLGQERCELSFPPLEHHIKYFKCGHLKNFRLSFMSDVVLKLEVIFSFDGVNDSFCEKFNCTKMFRNELITVKLPYFRLRLCNDFFPSIKNESLTLNIFIPQNQSLSISSGLPPPLIEEKRVTFSREPVEEKIEVEIVEEENKPLSKKEIFLMKMRGQKVPSQHKSPKQDFKDPRLPHFMVKNSLMYCDGFAWKILPVGEDNSVLTYVDNNLCWRKLTELEAEK